MLGRCRRVISEHRWLIEIERAGLIFLVFSNVVSLCSRVDDDDDRLDDYEVVAMTETFAAYLRQLIDMHVG